MFQQNFPQRSKNHILETASYKIFNNHIPNRWIVRELLERDYGVDALIEIVSDNNQVTGELISIQLKSSKNISFDNSGKHRFYNVKKQTTNYWLNSDIPMFLLLIDETKELIYFKSIEDYVRRSYERYDKESNFYYDFYKNETFNLPDFLKSYQLAKNLNEIEVELSSLNMFYNSFSSLYCNNIRRDFHMLVEDDDVLCKFQHATDVIKKMCHLLNIPWDLHLIDLYVENNDIGYDAGYDEYYIYEYHLTNYLIMLDKKLLEILKISKIFVCEMYPYFWQVKQFKLEKFLLVLKYSTLEDQYWDKNAVQQKNPVDSLKEECSGFDF